MLNVYFLRHGETPFNVDGNRYCGRTDAPLTEKGKGQARLVGEQLRGVALDGVYSSPLQRAYETALVAGGGGGEVVKDTRLIEVDFGKWEGLRREEFVAQDPASWEAWDADPGIARAGVVGETGLEVVQRVDDFFNEMIRRHPSGNILVAAHNGVNRLYLAYKLGMPLRNYRRIVQENSAITLFSLDEKGELLLKVLNG
ncbi:MAG TPA: histidine phosphatase family protein [Puia sp.]|jgi:alpha-ribazole phosphatase/probable phosphoglycerate mutase